MAAIRNRKLKLHLSWKVFLLLLLASNHDPLCFSAHSGSNLQLPEPRVILDTGGIINLRRACSARVTVVVLCMYVCVYRI